MNEKKDTKQAPTIAPGLDTDAKLSQSATEEDRRKGNATPVTIASYDEVDPS
ncbi:hypothetical protein [Neobacillus sp. YIM B06451]|uniref:hypothetical protein n=1 Tax=Neobacillus sp. YIM B06451 TaxID=3070994 RepID=UPI00292D095C|nr:hypothetical protein [Neobacillus sp. YIM B06451]